MAKTFATPNREILEAALQGLETQRQRLEEQISQVRSMMGQRAARPSKASATEASSERCTGVISRTKTTDLKSRSAEANRSSPEKAMG